MAPIPPLRDDAADRHLLPETLAILREEMADYRIPKALEPALKQYIVAYTNNEIPYKKVDALLYEGTNVKRGGFNRPETEHEAVVDAIGAYQRLKGAGKSDHAIQAIMDKTTDLLIDKDKSFETLAKEAAKKPDGELLNKIRAINGKYYDDRKKVNGALPERAGWIISVDMQQELTASLKKNNILAPKEQKAIRRLAEALGARNYSYKLLGDQINERSGGWGEAMFKLTASAVATRIYNEAKAEGLDSAGIIKSLSDQTHHYAHTANKLNSAGNDFHQKLPTAKTDNEKQALRDQLEKAVKKISTAEEILEKTLKKIQDKPAPGRSAAPVPDKAMAAALEHALDPAHRVHPGYEDKPISNEVQRTDPALKSLSI